MIALIGTLALINGALWRRMYGGWLAVSRAELLIVAVPLFTIPAWCVWHDLATCWRSVLVMAAIALQFAPSVDFDDWLPCAWRYTWGPALMFVAVPNEWILANLWFFSLFMIGPAIATVYYVGRKSTANGHPWAIHCPWDTASQLMLQGYTTFGELAAGGLSALAFTITPLLGS